MESGEFSRGKESIRADGGVVMAGNLDIEVEHQQRVGHLLSPLSSDMRDDTAFSDWTPLHPSAGRWNEPTAGLRVGDSPRHDCRAESWALRAIPARHAVAAMRARYR